MARIAIAASLLSIVAVGSVGVLRVALPVPPSRIVAEPLDPRGATPGDDGTLAWSTTRYGIDALETRRLGEPAALVVEDGLPLEPWLGERGGPLPAGSYALERQVLRVAPRAGTAGPSARWTLVYPALPVDAGFWARVAGRLSRIEVIPLAGVRHTDGARGVVGFDLRKLGPILAGDVLPFDRGAPLAAFDASRSGVRPGHFRLRGSKLVIKRADGTPIAAGDETTLAHVTAETPFRVESDEAKRLRRTLLDVAIVVQIAAAYVLRGRPSRSRATRAAFAVALFAALLLDRLPAWNVFFLSPDSRGYVQGLTMENPRSPGYPAFVRSLLGDADPKRLVKEIDVLGWRERTVHDPTSPLLRVVRAQTLSLLAAYATLGYVLSRRLSAPLLTGGLLLAAAAGFLSNEAGDVLSESLTQAGLFFLLASFAAFCMERSRAALLAIVALAPALYQTRPAAAFALGFVLVAVALLFAERGPAAWRPALAAVAIAVTIAAAPDLVRSFLQGRFVASPLYPRIAYAYALRVGDARDVERIPSPAARTLFAASLDEAHRGADDPPGAPGQDALFGPDTFNRYAWQTVNAVATRLGIEPRDVPALLLDASSPVLAAHRSDYARIVLDDLRIAVGPSSRLGDRIPLWLLLGIDAGLLVCFRPPLALFAVACIAAHFAHLLVVCASQPPLPRYVQATEILVWIGTLVLVIGAVQRIAARRSAAAAPA